MVSLGKDNPLNLNPQKNTLSINTDILTLTRHLIAQQQAHKEATGDFTLLLSSIQLACKFVNGKIRKAGINNLLGLFGSENVQGESQKKLDVIANEVFINSLRSSHKVAIMISEEDEAPIEVEIAQQGRYIVAFDPLDGSSNIDANVSVGTIFSIWKRKTPLGQPLTDEDILQTGDDLCCAGYCLYGSACQIVLCVGDEVNAYTLDPTLGEFLLTHPKMQCPPQGAIYSCNEGNSMLWDQPVKDYVQSKKYPPEGKKPYSLRYVGSMVADVHRTILYGGVFIYPADKKSKQGKLRVLYESMPMAYIIEKAGGAASTGAGRILSLKPTDIHQRCPVILGSKNDVGELEELYKNWKKE